ncbi:MAG TPA: hypothetical protein VML58_11110 [Burkholderiaceae bacterium]|nr:hypothetical protein [Burkholderiaceae bacterium]
MRMQLAAVMRLGCRGLRALPWLMVAWLASSCGGGTQQIEPFHPRQMIFVGDETVGLLPDGKRYGVNGFDTNGAFNCAVLPIWSQQLAGNFGFGVDNCASGAPGVTRAFPNAKVADLDAQISAQLAVGVTNKDLFVVMIGMNDIIDVYETFVGDRSCDAANNSPPGGSMMAELAARGHLAAVQISRIFAADGRAIVSTVHDIGLTPYARAKEAVVPGQMNLLTCMTQIFNARVRVDIRPLDGRFWGLVLADDLTVAIVRNPTGYNMANWTDGICTVPLPDCTTSTLSTGATVAPTNFLWADDRHFSPVVHDQLAAQAITRARNNPF